MGFDTKAIVKPAICKKHNAALFGYKQVELTALLNKAA